ncbi:MAG: IS110 family transposase [Planctomycetota bacterium]|mgnify:CR=1 FL=1
MSTEEQEAKSGRIIGMDAHPYMFTVATLEGRNPSTAQVVDVKDRLPIEQLDRWLDHAVHPGDVIVMEASGNSFALVDRITAKGHQAVVLESAAVGKIGKSYCATDKLDAIKVARVYITGLAHVVWKPDAKTMGRRELFFAYRNSVKDTTRCRNRIWAFFNQNGMKRPRKLRYSDPATEARVLALRPWTPLQKELINDLLTAFRQAEERRKRFNALIAEEVTSDPALLKLVRLMGVRHIVAFAMAAFIGQIARFPSPKCLVAYFGLNPCVSISGIGGGTGSLTHTGRSDVRALLIQAAQSILRYGTDRQHKWAVALKMRKGTNIAVAALARKLTVACWYLMRGLFSALTDVPKQLKIKLHKIACEIGSARIKARGYATVMEFEHELLETFSQVSG